MFKSMSLRSWHLRWQWYLWEVLNGWHGCSRIKTCRMVSFRKRKSLGERTGIDDLNVTSRFIKTTTRWIDFLLMSFNGPIKIPIRAW